MNVIRNAWELEGEDDGLLKLAGHQTRAEFERDRQRLAREIIAACSIRPDKRGFEIGSGDGTVARIMAPQCLSLDCNDISASFLERARTNCAQHANISFHRIEDKYLDHLPAESYDFGFALHVFIHFNAYDISNYLASVQRLLKPKGVFFFDACALGDQTMTVFREHAKMYADAPENIRGLLNYNHPHTLRTIIREAGLTISGRSQLSQRGWMKVVVVKPAGAHQGFRFLRG
jgi:ubiquinone/menaquinone biosynthesis C-methylase UbiE